MGMHAVMGFVFMVKGCHPTQGLEWGENPCYRGSTRPHLVASDCRVGGEAQDKARVSLKLSLKRILPTVRRSEGYLWDVVRWKISYRV